MTAIPPDPDPAETPALDAGGGVVPGSTPPASAQTSGVSEPDPPPTRRFTPSAIVTFIAIGVFVLTFLAAGVLLVLKMFGVWG
jgi:hypothetical protein